MPKAKVYAVRHGRDGPKIYNEWQECERAVKGWSAARYKGFPTLKEAEAWLESTLDDSAVANRSAITGTGQTPAISATEWNLSLPPASPLITPLDSELLTFDFITPPSTLAWHNNSSQTHESPKVFLSEEQQCVLDLVKQGKSVFFTGSAGTGKSVLLKEIINHFGGRMSSRLGITASTGVAAVNIGGVTLHSWAGIGLGIENVETLFNRITKNKHSYSRWLNVRTLIVDEISMIDGVLYDKLEHLACWLREDSRPFGGIQIILSGDFCQLPPVPGRNSTMTFAFEAESWGKCFETTPSAGIIRVLTKVFRQKDEDFVKLLNSLRYGKPDAAVSAAFLALSREVVYDDGLEPCELFPLREQVREANESRLVRLSGDLQTFHAIDIGGQDVNNRTISPKQAKDLLNKYVIASDTIQLKIGAQVMLIKNVVQGRLVNGSIGQIMGFQSLNEALDIHTEIAEIHKSKEGEKNAVQSFSRETLEECDLQSVNKLWPVVRFLNGEQLLITPAEFEVKNAQGKMEARRAQIPLILSWALSIHKSQGQTLERVKVNLHRTFEKGQAYVALSRATRLESLQVLGFNPFKVMAHPRVLEFYKQLDELCSQNNITSSSHDRSNEPEEFEMDDETAKAMYYSHLDEL